MCWQNLLFVPVVAAGWSQGLVLDITSVLASLDLAYLSRGHSELEPHPIKDLVLVYLSRRLNHRRVCQGMLSSGYQLTLTVIF